MTKRMLIDATHTEETRVAVLDGDKLVEYDYESAYRKALKGSIFLAKVTRVEPSLQAAFVNFGGNRHGFLPFSEIHPDYFKIPIADREALLAEQEEAAAAEEAEQEAEDAAVDDDSDEGDDAPQEVIEASSGDRPDSGDDQEDGSDAEENADDSDDDDNKKKSRGRRSRYPRRGGRGRRNNNSRRSEKYDDDEDNSYRSRFNLRRKYKIQEVIKRGQIMLVQASKEERGNKGAAVSTYLSLPGRYCVLMPNSPRAGGVSRKISNSKDRARMREIMRELQLPKGMSVILRTAGLSRTKTEIKRDLDYLMRLWDNIREQTLESSAPALIYEEANLIKRAVRDIYTRDVDQVEVAGEEGYKTAKQFMKMMIPSHAKRVQYYKDDDLPLFQRYQAEQQIAEIGEVQVTLPSGGYLVINPTEALVSVDVNSGKSTKERHIEDTALRTNLEAAEEVARQLRLRDLGGLVVIDFIDMENRRNNAKVERCMRDSLSTDRARVQMSRISNFGLMELSRQRMNPALTESQYETCAHCAGVGKVRTADALSLMVLRALEEEGVKSRAANVIVSVRNEVALYLLNYKRRRLSTIEERYGFKVEIRVDEKMSGSDFRLEVSRPLSDVDDVEDADEAEAKKHSGNRERNNNNNNNNNNNSDDDDDDNKKSSKGRKRGRRGGRRRNSNSDDADNRSDNKKDQNQDDSQQDAKKDDDAAQDKPKRGRRKSSSAKKEEQTEQSDKSGDEQEKQPEKKQQDDTADIKPAKKAASGRGRKKKDDEKKEEKSSEKKESSPASNDDKPAQAQKEPEKKQPVASRDPAEYQVVNAAPEKKKKGWWNKLTN